MRVAPPVCLSPEQRNELEQASRARSLPARLVERARIVLRAADGWLDKDIAAELGINSAVNFRFAKFRDEDLNLCKTVSRSLPLMLFGGG
jgi:FixJ family two-component response regulator